MSTPNLQLPTTKLGIGVLGVGSFYRLSSEAVLKRQRTGSVLCTSCGVLVGVNDERCYNCGRRNPGLWGFGPVLRRFGNDLGFVSLVIYGSAVLYTATLLVSLMLGENAENSPPMPMLPPSLGVAISVST